MAKNTVLIIFYLSMPIIIAAAAVGLVIALLQTLIQLQEQTLAFAAKMAAVVLMLALFGTSMASQLLTFLLQALHQISSI